MPYLISSFKGNKYFANKHFETIYPALFRKINVAYERERLELNDGDFLDLDWKRNKHDKLLILFHGLEGSSQSSYIKGFAQYFSGRGYDVCAVNFRGCSGEHNRLLNTYHGGKSDDVALVLKHIEEKYNYSKYVMGGFSLGGNVLLKYLGEQSENINPKIKKAFAFSVPVDMVGCAVTMSKASNKVYMQRFLSSLNKKILFKAKQFPNQIDTEPIKYIKTFYEWDDAYTAKINGFSGADEYYKQSSALQFLPAIAVPTLLVNAMNDPFLSATCYPVALAKQSNYLFLETPLKGGHVGFALSRATGSYYSEQRAFEFVSA